MQPTLRPRGVGDQDRQSCWRALLDDASARPNRWAPEGRRLAKIHRSSGVFTCRMERENGFGVFTWRGDEIVPTRRLADCVRTYPYAGRGKRRAMSRWTTAPASEQRRPQTRASA
jgi:hypothetical protein